MSDPRRVEAAIGERTRLIWMETPSNPLLKIFDVAAIAAIARARGVILAVDNTFATPMLQRPLALGASLSVHSTTKYLNGHSDVVGGAVMTSDDALAERLRFLQKSVGGVPSPFDCYLVLRGLKTLAVRMKRHVESARVLADYLAEPLRRRAGAIPGSRIARRLRSGRASDERSRRNDLARAERHAR